MENKSKITLGAQLYTLRDVMKDESSTADALKKVAQMGYTAVQLSAIPIGFDKPEWFKEECDKNGLSIISTHSSFDKMQTPEGLAELINDHKIYGCTNMGIGYMPNEYHSYEGFIKFAEIAEEIAQKVKEHGINLLYHNHRFEFEKFDGKLGIEILMEKAPSLMLLPDLYWVTAGGVCPMDFLKKAAGRYNQIHFKDYGIRNDAPYICEIGRGNIDYLAVSKYLSENGITNFVVEQDTCDGDPLDSLRISIDYIKTEILPNI